MLHSLGLRGVACICLALIGAVALLAAVLVGMEKESLGITLAGLATACATGIAGIASQAPRAAANHAPEPPAAPPGPPAGPR